MMTKRPPHPAMILLKWVIILLAIIIGILVARSQPVPMISSTVDANEPGGPLTRAAKLQWNASSNTTQYSWGFSNVATNMVGVTTGTNVPIIVVLGSNWARVRSENLTTNSPWTNIMAFMYPTSTVTLWPQPEYRDLLTNGQWANWSPLTNALPMTFQPTGWAREYRCKLTQSNWWDVR